MKYTLPLLVFCGLLLAGCQSGLAPNTTLGSVLPGSSSSSPLKKPSDLSVQDVQQIASAGADVYKALQLSDADVVSLGLQGIAHSDKQAKVAPANNKYAQRLAKLVAKHKNEDGMKLNFKVYLVNEINAFASPDGSIRVYSGLMDKMNDDELHYVIGHEIGHVKLKHSLTAYRAEYMARAAKKGVTVAAGSNVAKLAVNELGSLVEEGFNAQYSQENERQADDYGLAFNKKHKYNPKGAVTALEKLALMGNGEADFFSSHPAPADRAKRLKEQLGMK